MQMESNHIQNLYQACCKTPLLWKGNAVLDLMQLEFPTDQHSIFLRKLERQLRLGQLAEQFVFNALELCDTIELLAENIQIQKGKQTLGELDVLMTLDKQPIHLEIVYKFYVYDAAAGPSEIEQWIGPNRKDSLSEKLKKLGDKQLPLLYSNNCKNTLAQLNLDHLNFEQHILFKAQLFMPYQQVVNFEHLNEACVYGFYINVIQLEEFTDCQFYVPAKIDWFLNPNDNVDWLNYSSFKMAVNVYLENKQSPLFWMKNKTDELTKGFLVWW